MRHEADTACHAEFEAVAFQQVKNRALHLQGFGRHGRHLLQQDFGVACVDGQPPHLRDELAVAGALQRLLDARIGADVADGRHHVGQPLVLQRAQRDLDLHLGAVTALGHQVHLRAHRPRTRVAAIVVAVGGMARANALGHQRLHRQAAQLLQRVAEQAACRRVGEHDAAPGIDQQQRIRIG